MPLATRLVVTGPRYVEFSIRATIEVAAGRDPNDIKVDVVRELRKQLALVGEAPRHPGVPVTKRISPPRFAWSMAYAAWH
ncbi:MAG: hypothetical protein U1E63_15920 [Burkholderiales bacterium]